MNFLLLLYLNFIRGPQLAREKYEKEEKERLAKEAEDRKNGIEPPPKTCKKCDEIIDEKKTLYINIKRPLCQKCQIIEDADVKAEMLRMQEEMKMSPFLWFQVFVCLVGLVTFIHRNVFSLF